MKTKITVDNAHTMEIVDKAMTNAGYVLAQKTVYSDYSAILEYIAKENDYRPFESLDEAEQYLGIGFWKRATMTWYTMIAVSHDSVILEARNNDTIIKVLFTDLFATYNMDGGGGFVPAGVPNI